MLDHYKLKQISDSLKNEEVYAALGVSAPKGLLLYGEPGVGKSLMANAIIEESGRQVFTCRKEKPNGDFINEIKETFDKAAENAPSIVYLDDMDKFTNGDENHPDAEEYVTVQSCIDRVKEKRVFVLATANNIRCLPNSLRRVGRFDRKIEVRAPRGEDAEKIIGHYLENKKYVDGMDARTIARIMNGRSCAEIEKYYRKAKEIISLNIDFVGMVAAALTQKHILSAVDINQIKSECTIKRNVSLV
ncbi:MAG: ATP-binding protein [Lachnospiraceae bacterium]|nr:ATP-binding protein [Lachnospiraceae bacterium]